MKVYLKFQKLDGYTEQYYTLEISSSKYELEVSDIFDDFMYLYNDNNLKNKLYVLEYFNVNFIIFMLTEYYSNDIISTINDTDISIIIKLQISLNKLQSILKNINNIVNSNDDIIDWLKSEIKKNHLFVSNKYLLNIIKKKVKHKYKHILNAKKFDLI